MIKDVTAYADAAARRYTHLLRGFQGFFANALRDQWSLARRRDAAVHAYNMAGIFDQREREQIERETYQIAHIARERAGAQLGVSLTPISDDPVLSEHLRDVSSYLFGLVWNQVERDVTALREALSRAAFEVHRTARADGVSTDQALARLRAAGSLQLNFVFRDRGGRRLASEKHIRAIWRHHLLTVFNEVTLHVLAEHGETRAEIAHPDPNHRWAGEVVAIAGDAGTVSYADIRDEVFHPNSDAHLVRVGHSQLTDFRI